METVRQMAKKILMPKQDVEFDRPIWMRGEYYAQAHDALPLYVSLPVWTYRSGFTPICRQPEPLTSDSGWGCVVRSTQMLLCMVLQRHNCLRLEWFMDVPSAPFSIHRLVRHSITTNKTSHCAKGDTWWQPSQGAAAIRHFVTMNKAVVPNLEAMVAADSVICVEDVADHVQAGRSVLVMAPFYAQDEAKKYVLQMMRVKCFMGVIGGEYQRSYLMVGYQEQFPAPSLILLDPHVKTQNAFISPSTIGMCHQTHFLTLPIERMDECGVACFYITSLDNLDQLVAMFLATENPFLAFKTRREIAADRAKLDDMLMEEDEEAAAEAGGEGWHRLPSDGPDRRSCGTASRPRASDGAVGAFARPAEEEDDENVQVEVCQSALVLHSIVGDNFVEVEKVDRDETAAPPKPPPGHSHVANVGNQSFSDWNLV